MEIYFIQHCQLILQDSLLITKVPNQCTILVSCLDKDGIIFYHGSWSWSCWCCWRGWSSSLLDILFNRVSVRPCHCELFVSPVAELTWNCIGNLYQVSLHNCGRGGVVTDRTTTSARTHYLLSSRDHQPNQILPIICSRETQQKSYLLSSFSIHSENHNKMCIKG